MLLEFRVRNFGSIRDEQCLSFVASADRELAASHTGATGLKSPAQAVRSAVIYGPNASGKTTLLKALDYMRAVVAESATVIQPGQTYNVQPFRLDPARAAEPTAFELSFVHAGLRHQYAFEMTAQRIVSESLVVWHSAKPTQWFSRRFDGERDVYEFSAYLKGARKLWQDSTRANALFLSMAAQLNADQMVPVYRAIVDCLVYLPAHASLNHELTTHLLASAAGRLAVRDFLSTADISIAEVKTTAMRGVTDNFAFGADGVVHMGKEESEILVPLFEHSTSAGKASFELHEESEGTQRLYCLVAPVLDVLRDGRALVVDELDSSLHTLLVRRLVAMFHDPALNPRGAQLVFTTHDTSLLDQGLFRRDQIWFTEKDADQATRLYPLSDFSPRKHEALERGYLAGRYGAVPVLRSLPAIALPPGPRGATRGGAQRSSTGA
ncbi:AAA family ATPase [Derxia lacustris]|uniref:AAA family ATPase n=1 Tax=Derxia lacustris TaxID=764842 RepID=UPI000A16D3E3|nr:ATP-binding protein [Derxia lacustris]